MRMPWHGIARGAHSIDIEVAHGMRPAGHGPAIMEHGGARGGLSHIEVVIEEQRKIARQQLLCRVDRG